jgi:hypothetical protein
VVWIDVCSPPRHNIYHVIKVSSVDQAVTDLVKGVSIWVVLGLEVDFSSLRSFSIVFTCRLCLSIVGWCTVSRPTFAFMTWAGCVCRSSCEPWPPLRSHLLVHVCWWESSCIVAFAILYFLSSLIVIRRPPGLYSDRTFQVAYHKSFLRLLLVFIVLICPIFSSFSIVRSVFSVDGDGHVLVVTFQASSHTVAVTGIRRPTGFIRCV